MLYADIAAMVRHDVQQMATDVHVALGLQKRPLPPATGNALLDLVQPSCRL